VNKPEGPGHKRADDEGCKRDADDGDGIQALDHHRRRLVAPGTAGTTTLGSHCINALSTSI